MPRPEHEGSPKGDSTPRCGNRNLTIRAAFRPEGSASFLLQGRPVDADHMEVQPPGLDRESAKRTGLGALLAGQGLLQVWSRLSGAAAVAFVPRATAFRALRVPGAQTMMMGIQASSRELNLASAREPAGR